MMQIYKHKSNNIQEYTLQLDKVTKKKIHNLHSHNNFLLICSCYLNMYKSLSSNSKMHKNQRRRQCRLPTHHITWNHHSNKVNSRSFLLCKINWIPSSPIQKAQYRILNYLHSHWKILLYSINWNHYLLAKSRS